VKRRQHDQNAPLTKYAAVARKEGNKRRMGNPSEPQSQRVAVVEGNELSARKRECLRRTRRRTKKAVYSNRRNMFQIKRGSRIRWQEACTTHVEQTIHNGNARARAMENAALP